MVLDLFNGFVQLLMIPRFAMADLLSVGKKAPQTPHLCICTVIVST